MIDFAGAREFLAWARHHTWTATVVVALMMTTSMGYAFLTGYATQFGQRFATEYPTFRQSVATYTVVDILLQHLLVQYHAARVGVLRFHDSVRDVATNPVFFVSGETVVTAPGVALNIDELRNLPASDFSSILPTLMNRKPMLLRTGDITTAALRELSVKRGVHAALFSPIYDLSDQLIGMLVMSWMNDPDVPQGAELADAEAKLTTAADRIGAYMSKR